MRKNDIFKEKNKNNGSLKYFIIAFAVFIVALAAVSAYLFMRSIDFDFGNLINAETDSTSQSETEPVSITYSVNDLSGKCCVLFICEDNNGKLQYAFSVDTDFGAKSMFINVVDGADKAEYNGSSISYTDLYEKYRVAGVKEAFSFLNIVAEKYVVFDKNAFLTFFSEFDGISVNVKEKVDYKSDSFNLELDTGKQILSAEYLYKYLEVSNNQTRASVICDIVSGVLRPEYTEKSERLFNKFVNSTKTDISVIDYSEFINNLIVYSKAEDKFLPQIKQP
ncbi:MAG: LCP family protein [Candidatus Fimenecus sp.]